MIHNIRSHLLSLLIIGSLIILFPPANCYANSNLAGERTNTSLFNTKNDQLPTPFLDKKQGGLIVKNQNITSLLNGNHFSPDYIGNPTYPMTICVMEALIDGANLEAGDEIGVFDGDICVGAGVLTAVIDTANDNTYLYIQCGKDDPATPQQDGYIQGHEILYKLWDASMDAESYTETSVYPYPGWDFAQFAQLETSVTRLNGEFAVKTNIKAPYVCKNIPLEQFTIPIIAKTINKAFAFHLKFTFDNSLLSFDGTAMQNLVFNSNPILVSENNGSVELNWTSSGDSLFIINDTLISFHFSSSHTGSADINWENNDCYYLKQDGDTMASLYSVAPLYIANIPQISTVTTSNLSCHDANDGSITIMGSGDTELSYTVNNGNDWQENSGLFTNLNGGDYTVAVVDTFGCRTDWTNNPVIILNPEALAFDNIDTQDVSGCFNSDNGSITITASGGTGSIMHSIDDGNNWSENNIFTDLPTGEYTLHIRDENLCQLAYENNPVVISGPEAVLISDIAIQDVSLCHGNQNGSINITASGGVAPLQYSIDDGANWQASPLFSDLFSGSYNVRVKDANNCSLVYGQNPMIISEPPIIEITDVLIENISCNGLNDGVINITASGGSGILNYSIDNGINWQSASLFENLPAGDYHIKIKDEHDCELIYENNPITITQPEAVNLDELIISFVQCYGGNDGIIDISGSGGTGNLSYSIDNGNYWSSSGLFGELSSGEYFIKIKDENECLYIYNNNPVLIIEPEALEISSIETTNLQCHSIYEGSINITASGGSGILNYSIDNGTNWQSTSLFENLPAGDYHIKIKDEHDCELIYENNPITITQPEAVNLDELIITDVQCNGADDGIIEITGSGGTGNLSYSIDNGNYWSSSGLFGELSSGEYFIQIKDENECLYIYNNNPVLIIEPEALEISSIETTNLQCHSIYEGSINITASGGSGILNYSIDNGISWQSASLFENLPSSDYHIKIKDEHDCELIYENNPITITQPEAVNLDELIITDVQCNGADDGIIDISGSGGTGNLSYSIDNGNYWSSSGIFGELSSGEYFIKIKDENECLYIYNNNPVLIIEPEALEISSIETTNLQCHSIYEGSINITASGGSGILNYSIDNGTNWQSTSLFENLPAGDYHIKIKDEHDCELIYENNPITITQPEAVNLDELIITDVQCNGADDGIIDISGSGGTGNLSYSIDNGNYWSSSGLFGELSSGDYTIQIKDENECIFNYPENPITVNEPEALIISDVQGQNILCYGSTDGIISIIATGGSNDLQYSIDNGLNWQAAMTFENLAQGNYTIIAKDAHNCQTEWPANPHIISEPAELIINSVQYFKESKNGANDARIIIQASGGSDNLFYSLDNGQSWHENNGDFIALSAGSYNIQVKDANGCTSIFNNNPIIIPEVHFSTIWTGNPLNPMNFTITNALIEDTEMQWMDEIAIYDGDQCVGSGVLDQCIDSLDNNTYINIICSMDDPDQAGINGYTPGNDIKYRIWDENSQLEYTYVYTIFQYAPQFAWEVFTIDESTIAQLKGLAEQTQQFNLTTGWNMISWNIMPENYDMETLMQSLINTDPQLKIIDESGQIVQHMPWGWINTIGDMSNTEGYQIKVTTDAEFSTNGAAVQMPISIAMSPAWNIISWPAQETADAQNVMQQLIDAGALDKVIDQNGNLLQELPWGWVNTIGNFEPAQGYQVKVFADCSLDLNENFGDYKSDARSQAKTRLLKPINHGRPFNPMTFAIQNNGQLQRYTEIGVYENDQCLGAAVVTGEYIYFPAGIDEEQTSVKEGFTPGANFHFRYITEGMEQAEKLDVTYLEGDKIFTKLGSFVGEINTLTTAHEIESNRNWIGEAHPNPTRNEVMLDMEFTSEVQLSYYFLNAQGCIIQHNEINIAAGSVQQHFDLSNFLPGVYYVHIQAVGSKWSSKKVQRIVHL